MFCLELMLILMKWMFFCLYWCDSVISLGIFLMYGLYYDVQKLMMIFWFLKVVSVVGLLLMLVSDDVYSCLIGLLWVVGVVMVILLLIVLWNQ